MNTREAAALYISRGWYPIPLKAGSKDLRDKDGLRKIYLAEEFEPDDNIGLHLVSQRDNDRAVKLIAVDFDAPEIGPKEAWTFLPPTCGWGRETKSISQLLYVSPFERSLVHKDACFQVDVSNVELKATIIEIRAEHQSMCPPSVHPNGERVTWITDPPGDAAGIVPAALRRGVDLLATYVMVARYYPPPKARHFWGLYLAGFLRQLGLSLEESTNVFKLAAAKVKDKETKDRVAAVENTYAKPEDDPLAGSQKLAEEIGEKGKAFISSLRKIWGVTGTGFVTDDSGKKILASQENIRRALQKLDVTLSENLFAKRIMVNNGRYTGQLNDAVVTHVWLETEKRFGFRPTKDYFYDVMSDEGRSKPFHPVLDYLDTLKWDGKPRINRWLVDYGSAPDNDYVNAISGLVLIAAVRRVRKPGCKFDELLILESPQGWDKSSALRALCPNDDWFSDDLPLGIDAKQTIERTAGRWIIEIAELVGSKRESDHLKAFLSRQVDGPVRAAWARLSEPVPRQFIMIGTTNLGAYLNDKTGGRRFWPVAVQRFNVEALKVDREQLWAEAAHREEEGESIRLDPSLWNSAAQHQEDRRLLDPWEDVITEFVNNMESDDRGRQRVMPKVIFERLGIPVERQDDRNNSRITDIMLRLNFRRIAVRTGDAIIKGWGRDLIEGVWRPAGWRISAEQRVERMSKVRLKNEPEQMSELSDLDDEL